MDEEDDPCLLQTSNHNNVYLFDVKNLEKSN